MNYIVFAVFHGPTDRQYDIFAKRNMLHKLTDNGFDELSDLPLFLEDVQDTHVTQDASAWLSHGSGLGRPPFRCSETNLTDTLSRRL